MESGINTDGRLRTLLGLGCCLSYFCIAFYATTMGPAAAAIMSRWTLDGAQQGLILTIQSIGGILLATLFLLFGSRLSKLRVQLCGLAVLLLAFALMSLSPGLKNGYTALLLIAIPAGLGFTAIDVMVNGVVVDVFGEKSGTVLSFAHASYSVGATLSPFFASFLIRSDMPSSYGRAYLLGGVFCLVTLLLTLLAARGLRRQSLLPVPRPAQPDGVSGARILKSPRAWLYLVCGLFYFCFLWGVTTWLPSYCRSVSGFTERLSSLTASGFFLGALVMRFLTPLLLKKLSQRRLFLLSAALSAFCMLGAALLSLPALILPLVILSGFFQGTLVICFVLLCCEAFPADSAGASAIAVLASTLGMFIAPFVMGAVSGRFSFRASLCVAITCLAASFLTAIITFSIQRKKA